MKFINNNHLFLSSVTLLYLVSFLMKTFLDIEELLSNFYAENYVQERIEEIIEQQQKW